MGVSLIMRIMPARVAAVSSRSRFDGVDATRHQLDGVDAKRTPRHAMALVDRAQEVRREEVTREHRDRRRIRFSHIVQQRLEPRKVIEGVDVGDLYNRESSRSR